MQKRSKYQIIYAPIHLKNDFPIQGGNPYEQMDRPITFLHTHECLELGYCYSGSGIFVVGDKVLPFKQGDVSFINHAEPHLARSAPGTSSHWTWIYVDPLKLLHTVADQLKTIDPTPLAEPEFKNMISPEDAPVDRIVLRMVDELKKRRTGHESCLKALTWELMTLIHRMTDLTHHIPPSHAEYNRIAPALQHITQHYTQCVDIDLLAQRCNMSVPHFRRIFTATIGRPPREYWLDLRMRMAATLLRTTSRPIMQISYDVGFETLSSFNRLFHDTFEMSPREWRKSGVN